MKTQNSFPLSWPAAWKRTTSRSTAGFGRHSVDGATREILRQLKLLGVGDWEVVISTNVPLRRDGLPYSNMRQPEDPGAAVYFQLNGRPCVLAVDKWRTVEENLWAIAKDIEAQRGRIRWGVGSVDQAFAGYTAIGNGGETHRPWREVLRIIPGEVTRAEIETAYRELSKRHHPDLGGSTAAMAELNVARDQALNEITRA